jgi:hypothetical protein
VSSSIRTRSALSDPQFLRACRPITSAIVPCRSAAAVMAEPFAASAAPVSASAWLPLLRAESCSATPFSVTGYCSHAMPTIDPLAGCEVPTSWSPQARQAPDRRPPRERRPLIAKSPITRCSVVPRPCRPSPPKGAS